MAVFPGIVIESVELSQGSDTTGKKFTAGTYSSKIYCVNIPMFPASSAALHVRAIEQGIRLSQKLTVGAVSLLSLASALPV